MAHFQISEEKLYIAILNDPTVEGVGDQGREGRGRVEKGGTGWRREGQGREGRGRAEKGEAGRRREGQGEEGRGRVKKGGAR